MDINEIADSKSQLQCTSCERPVRKGRICQIKAYKNYNNVMIQVFFLNVCIWKELK